MHKFLQIFTPYVVAFILITAICGLVYATIQQVLRQGANDPQIQIAEDGAAAMKAGQQPHFDDNKTDIVQSLSTFLGIYDKDGNPTDSSAILDGQMPKPPVGIFSVAKQKGQHRVTWQPRPGVRLALVIVPVDNEDGQFVVAGRSLREVEKRENRTFQMAVAAWVAMTIVAFIGITAFIRRNA